MKIHEIADGGAIENIALETAVASSMKDHK